MTNGIFYLSGGMEHADNKGAAWRKNVTEQLQALDFKTIDITAIDLAYIQFHGPVYLPKDIDEKNILQYKSNIRRQFIYTDLRLIKDDADGVIAYYDESFRLGAGSFAECQTAYDCEKPLFLVNGFSSLADVPGWLKALTTKIFMSFDDLYKYLGSLPPGIVKKDRYGNHSAKDEYLCSLCGDVFKKSKHHFVSKVTPLYCKPCIDLVTKTHEAHADRYEFAVKQIQGEDEFWKTIK